MKPMNRLLHALALMILLVAGGPCAFAHEFWLLPDSFQVQPASRVDLAFFVGQDFSGERVGVSRDVVTRASHYSSGRIADLRPQLPLTASASFPFVAGRSGMHVLAINTNPNFLVLDADKFNGYLELEGLSQVLEARARKGAMAQPGRERYRRNIKTLIRAGSAPDKAWSWRAGQKLEIVPLADPTLSQPGGDIAFEVLFDGKPLVGALVKSWHRGEEGLLAAGDRTDSRGRVRMQVQRPGVWMISVVHMVPATGSPEFDWDSYWGNLTFERSPDK